MKIVIIIKPNKKKKVVVKTSDYIYQENKDSITELMDILGRGIKDGTTSTRKE